MALFIKKPKNQSSIFLGKDPKLGLTLGKSAIDVAQASRIATTREFLQRSDVPGIPLDPTKGLGFTPTPIQAQDFGADILPQRTPTQPTIAGPPTGVVSSLEQQDIRLRNILLRAQQELSQEEMRRIIEQFNPAAIRESERSISGRLPDPIAEGFGRIERGIGRGGKDPRGVIGQIQLEVRKGGGKALVLAELVRRFGGAVAPAVTQPTTIEEFNQQMVTTQPTVPTDGGQQAPEDIVKQVEAAQQAVQQLGQQIAALQPTEPELPTDDVDLVGQVGGEIPSDAIEEPVTDSDLTKLFGEQRGLREQLLTSLQPTEEELRLQEELTEFRGEARTAISEEGERVAPLALVTGRQAALREQAAIQEQTLMDRLGIQQEKRKGVIEVFKTALGFTKEDIDTQFKIEDAIRKQESEFLKQTNVLTDDARQALSLMLQNTKGVRFEDLDGTSQSKLVNITRQAGIPFGALIQGMELQANKFDQEMINLAKKGEADVTSLAKLSSANITRLATAGVPTDISRGIFEDLQNGFSLEQIRTNLAEEFGRELGFGYLDRFMETIQKESSGLSFEDF